MQNTTHLTIEILFSRDKTCNSIIIIDSEKAMHSSMLNQGQGLTITRKRVENSNGTFLIKNGGIEISFSL
jgi:hypothetical protein